jgi:hypothetical protein
MRKFSILLFLMLGACAINAGVLPSQKVKNPRAKDIVGCYMLNTGGIWLLLREDLTSKVGDAHESSKSVERWYIQDSKVLFGEPNEIKFWWLDVYFVPGSGYVLTDGSQIYRVASKEVCGA